MMNNKFITNTVKKYAPKSTVTAKKICQLLNTGKIRDLPLDNGVLLDAFENVVGSAKTLLIDSNRILYTAVGASGIFGIVIKFDNNGITAIGSSVVIDTTTSLSSYDILPSSSGGYYVATTTSAPSMLGSYFTISGTTITSSVIADNESTSAFDSCITAIVGAIGVFFFTLSTGSIRAVAFTGTSTITNGGTAIFQSGVALTLLKVITLDSTHALVIYDDTVNTYGVIATFSSTTVTFGTGVQIASGLMSVVRLNLMDTTRVLLISRRTVDGMPMGIVITWNSSTSLTAGTYTQLHTYSEVVTQADNIISTITSGSKYLITYNTTSYGKYAIVLTISGSTITPGTPIRVDSPYACSLNAGLTTVTILSTTKALIVYRRNSDSKPVYLVVNMADTVLSLGTPQVYDLITPYVSIMPDHNGVALSSTCGFMLFRTTAGSYAFTFTLNNDGDFNVGVPIGMVDSSDGTVILKGIVGGLSGLSPGRKYYYTPNGDITTEWFVPYRYQLRTNAYLGVAVSTTELYITDFLV